MNVLNHPHPGETLRDQVIEPLHMTVSEAAQKLGMSRPALSRVLNGKAGISPDLAIRLEMAGISTARFWTSLQAQHAFKGGLAAAAGTRRAGAARSGSRAAMGIPGRAAAVLETSQGEAACVGKKVRV